MCSMPIPTYERQNLGIQTIVPEWQVALFCTRKCLQSFYLSVARHKTVHLNITKSDQCYFDVFDGPTGHESYKLTNVKSLYRTSTFQCVIYAFIHQKFNAKARLFSKTLFSESENCHNFNAEKLINFHSADGAHPRTTLSVHEDEKSLSFPTINLCMLLRICAIKLSSTWYKYLKVSIETLFFGMGQGSECRSNSISFYDSVGETLQELSLFCSDSRQQKYYRTIVSNSSNVFVILYNIFNLSKAQVSLLIAPTDCQPIEINACEEQPSHTFWFNPDDQGHRSVELKTRKCVFIRVTNKPTTVDNMRKSRNVYRDFCHVMIRPESQFEEESHTKYKIEGYFSTFFDTNQMNHSKAVRVLCKYCLTVCRKCCVYFF